MGPTFAGRIRQPRESLDVSLTDGVCHLTTRCVQGFGLDCLQIITYRCGLNQNFPRSSPVAVFPLLFFARSPKRFAPFHIHLIAPPIPPPLPPTPPHPSP